MKHLHKEAMPHAHSQYICIKYDFLRNEIPIKLKNELKLSSVRNNIIQRTELFVSKLILSIVRRNAEWKSINIYIRIIQ